MSRDPILSLILAMAALMVYATLYPFQFVSQPGTFFVFTWPDSSAHWLDVALNFYFFFPLGIAMGLRFQGRYGFLQGFLLALGLTSGVEFAQAFIPGRYSSSRDVFMNVLGANAGILIAKLPLFDADRLSAILRAALRIRGIALLCVLWLVHQFFPFIPSLRWSTLRYALDQPLHWDQVGWFQWEAIAVAAIVILLLHEAHGPRIALGGSILLLAILPFQLLILGRNPSLISLAMTLAGLLLGSVLVVQQINPGSRALVILAVALVLFRQIQPLSWDAASFHPFEWVPFQATFSSVRDGALRVLSLKCFLYWYMLRQLCRHTGWSALPMALTASALLLLSEFAQCWQPGRSPEITDSLVCLLGALPALGITNYGLNRVER